MIYVLFLAFLYEPQKTEVDQRNWLSPHKTSVRMNRHYIISFPDSLTSFNKKSHTIHTGTLNLT